MGLVDQYYVPSCLGKVQGCPNTAHTAADYEYLVACFGSFLLLHCHRDPLSKFE